MITEYIKRDQKMGFNEEGALVYKVPVDATIAPVEEEFVLLYDDVEEED